MAPGDIAYPVAPARKLALALTGTPAFHILYSVFSILLSRFCKPLVRVFKYLIKSEQWSICLCRHSCLFMFCKPVDTVSTTVICPDRHSCFSYFVSQSASFHFGIYSLWYLFTSAYFHFRIFSLRYLFISASFHFGIFSVRHLFTLAYLHLSWHRAALLSCHLSRLLHRLLKKD